jgi:hypothetical protein
MKIFTLTLSDLDIDKNEIYLNLGYHGQLPEEHIIQMVDDMIYSVSEICYPKVGYDFFYDIKIDRHIIEINDVPMKTGSVIAGYMLPASIIATFVATAGSEYDDYLHKFRAESDIVNEYFANAIGSEIAEAAVRYVSHKINEEAKTLQLKTTNSYCPGYCGWQVREQEKLFSLLPEEPCGIKLNESCLMYPIKSVSGIIGLGTNMEYTPYACEICGMTTCFKRKI